EAFMRSTSVAICLALAMGGCASSAEIQRGAYDHAARARELEAHGDYTRAAKERAAADRQFRKAQMRASEEAYWGYYGPPAGRQMRDYLRDMVGAPETLRFFIQPALAILLGLRDGLADYRSRQPPYVLALATQRGERRKRLKAGLRQILIPLCIAIAASC